MDRSGDIDVKKRLTRKTISPNDLEISRKNHPVGRIDEALIKGARSGWPLRLDKNLVTECLARSPKRFGGNVGVNNSRQA
jgi:hypothetical protein